MALGGLQQQLEEAVQRHSTEIENKIRAFTAEQYQLLERFRERAHNEHRLLTRFPLTIYSIFVIHQNYLFYINTFKMLLFQVNMQRRRNS